MNTENVNPDINLILQNTKVRTLNIIKGFYLNYDLINQYTFKVQSKF